MLVVISATDNIGFHLCICRLTNNVVGTNKRQFMFLLHKVKEIIRTCQFGIDNCLIYVWI